MPGTLARTVRALRTTVQPEVGQVEQQRLVAPVIDVGYLGVDLVGKVLPSSWCLGDLEQQAGREDAL